MPSLQWIGKQAVIDHLAHVDDDTEILDNKLVRAVRVASGWSSKSILQKFIAADFSPVPDSNGQLTYFVITATGAIESIKQRSQASHVLSVLSGLGSTQAQSAVPVPRRRPCWGSMPPTAARGVSYWLKWRATSRAM